MAGNITLGAILKKYRLKFGFTQQQISDFLNITRSAYAYYETRNTQPSIDALKKLSQLYGVSIIDFFPDDKKDLAFNDSQLENKNEVPDSILLLNKVEKELVASYRLVSPKTQRIIWKEIEKYIESN